MRRVEPRVLLGIFLVSAATLCLEISLLRYFSLTQQYHFAFFVVSIAFLGYGASGSFLSLFHRLAQADKDTFLSLSSLLFAVSVVLSFILCKALAFDFQKLAWDRRQILLILAYYLLLSVPFLFAGATLSFAVTRLSRWVHKVYFADLVGAGTGTLLTLVIFLPKGDKGVIPLISLLILMASFLFSVKRPLIQKGLILLLVAAELLMLIKAPDFLGFRISPFKALPTALQYPDARMLFTRWNAISRVDVLDSPAVRFAPGLSLIHTRSLPPQLGISIDGGELTAATAFDRPEDPSLEFLKALPSSAAYLLLPEPSVLVLEPRGGLDVLAALVHGASRVKAVESQPLLVRILKQELAEFTGQLYTDERVQVRVAHGRSALKQEDGTYDLIILSLTDVFGSSGTGLFGFGENYLYTHESFNTILDRLSPRGLACMSLYILPPPRQELRAMATWIEALDTRGKDPRLHLLALRSWSTLTFFVKSSPVTEEDILAIKDHAERNLFDLVYYPGITPKETNIHNRFKTPIYYDYTMQLLDPVQREALYDEYLFKIRPVSDDRPFFYNFFKLGKISDTFEAFGRNWLPFLQGEFLVPLLLAQAICIAFVLIMLPVLVLKRETGCEKAVLRKVLGYFGLIGMAFMFIEITLIQRFILFLGHPLYAFAVTLFSLLLASGTGSYASKTLLGRDLLKRLRFILIFLALLITAALLLLPPIEDGLIGWSLPVKMVLTLLLVFPLGFLMGFPFPSGIRMLESRSRRLIPWAWAANAFSSVVSSISALLVAFYGGYSLVLALAAAGYLSALPLLSFTGHGHKSNA